MTQVVRLEIEGSVGLVIVNNPPVNALSSEVREGLHRCFKKADDDPQVEAIVLICEGRTFVSGADLAELGGVIKEPGYHEILHVIEQTSKPVVAALHGTALGGGVELALACHARVGDPEAKLGFPEINLGLVPGAGGTQRLPRLVGVRRAVELFLGGRPIDAIEASKTGLLDAIAEGSLRTFAVRYATKLVEDNAPIRRTCDMPMEPDDTISAFLVSERKRVGSAITGRVVPAMDIDAVEAALSLPFEEGLERERIISDESLRTRESQGMRRLFFAERQASKIPGISPGLATNISSGGIIGAGTMGRGIAIAFANSGISVTLMDVDQEAVDTAMSDIRASFDSRVKRGRLEAAEAQRRLSLIAGATDYSDLSDADVVIEAVFESMSLKKEVFKKLDKHCKSDAVLATNTSTLDVLEIARTTQRAPSVVGLHFFSPAHATRLVEIVRSKETADAVIATAMKLAARLRKVGVLSANAYGFIGNRMMDPYGREAERLLLEGATPQQVDGALERFGMSMGILAVFDMAGVDVGVRVRQEHVGNLPDDASFYRSSALLVENGMLGQKSGSGFYRYQNGKRERLENPDALDLFAREAERLGIERREISDHEIVERCIYSLINEGVRVLEEGTAMKASDIDVVYTSGYGFPRYLGGPMFHADSLGLDHIVERMEHYAGVFGPEYWQPADLLQKLAKINRLLADMDQGAVDGIDHSGIAAQVPS